MKTFLATFIVLLFCLSTISQVAGSTITGQKAEDILLKGSIIDKSIYGETFIYLVELKGDAWLCKFGLNHNKYASFWCESGE